MQRVKIVATAGPATSSRQVIRQLIEAGVDVVRLNFSHGDHQGHQQVFELVREESDRAGVFTGVLADLSGPKIRTGEVSGGAIELCEGQDIAITAEEVIGDSRCISTSYRELHRDVKPGDRILLDDGMLALRVQRVDQSLVRCSVVVGGVLRDRKGMNIPGTPLSTPALTQKDRRDLEFSRELGVDYFALSFVRSADDLKAAKALAGDVPVIAKIEKPQAVANLNEIIAVADGLMVARGDLGVEAGAEKVPLLQKRIIKDATARGLPVIVATQMLQSMIHSPTPTRAEVSDVANAVLDGTDAVMLSGETAVGKYPIEAVREMAAVLTEVEQSDIYRQKPARVRLEEPRFANAIAQSAVTAAIDLDLKGIAVYTESGRSASLVSSCRPKSAIVAFSRHESVLRRLALRWGVVPLRGQWVEDMQGAIDQAVRLLTDCGLTQSGDDIAVTYGEESAAGFTDTLKLVRLK